MCGCGPRPQDLDLHPTNKGQTQERGRSKDKRDIEAHGISNEHIDLRAQTWHKEHKHTNLNIGMTEG